MTTMTTARWANRQEVPRPSPVEHWAAAVLTEDTHGSATEIIYLGGSPDEPNGKALRSSSRGSIKLSDLDDQSWTWRRDGDVITVLHNGLTEAELSYKDIPATE